MLIRNLADKCITHKPYVTFLILVNDTCMVQTRLGNPTDKDGLLLEYQVTPSFLV